MAASETYLFHHSCFDREQYLKELNLFAEHEIKFQVNDHSGPIQFKSPACGYFEAEILIQESDFDRANDLLEGLNTYGN